LVKAIELCLPVISDIRNPSWIPIQKDAVPKDVRSFHAIGLSAKSGRIEDMIVVIHTDDRALSGRWVLAGTADNETVSFVSSEEGWMRITALCRAEAFANLGSIVGLKGRDGLSRWLWCPALEGPTMPSASHQDCIAPDCADESDHSRQRSSGNGK
jgi:hypothetical protein